MKTVSLELAIDLKGAGYPQENSNFYHKAAAEYYGLVTDNLDDGYPVGISRKHGAIHYAAPTVDEILDQCKAEIDIITWNEANWIIEIGMFTGGIIPKFEAESLADAAAKAWLYLKKKGLL